MSLLRFLLILLLSTVMNVKCSEEHVELSYKIEALPNSYANHGEGPHWDIDSQSLYYVDIEAGKLLRYDYQEDKVYKTKIEGEDLASFVIPIEGQNDKFIVGAERRAVIVDWDGISNTSKVDSVLFEVQPGEEYIGNRFNDAKVDPRGRFFGGTMRYIGDALTYKLSALYKYEKGGNLSALRQDVGISNGMTWNEKLKKFYYIDTATHEVSAYDYDFDTGVASNPKVIFDLHRPGTEDDLLPDGMTIDSEGNLYVATYNGYTVYKVNPSTGKVLLEIKLPTKQISSVAWGGPNLDILYVTTAATDVEPAPAGTTFKVTGLGAKGLPMKKFQV